MSFLWKNSCLIAALSVLSACSTPQLSSAIPLPFQALGNEPGWTVLISADQTAAIRLNYGETNYQLALPRAQYSYAGTHYRSTFNQQPFSLDILINTCSDTMSDTVYDYEAVLQINGETYTGCGRKQP